MYDFDEQSRVHGFIFSLIILICLTCLGFVIEVGKAANLNLVFSSANLYKMEGLEYEEESEFLDTETLMKAEYSSLEGVNFTEDTDKIYLNYEGYTFSIRKVKFDE